MDDTAKVFENADIAIATFVGSLTPRQHIPIRNEAKIMLLGEREYAKRLRAPPEDYSEDEQKSIKNSFFQIAVFRRSGKINFLIDF